MRKRTTTSIPPATHALANEQLSEVFGGGLNEVLGNFGAQVGEAIDRLVNFVSTPPAKVNRGD